MPERVRAWLQDLAHVLTIVSALVVLGVGGVVAVAFQAVLGAPFTLSVTERVMLGLCAFLVVLAIILAILRRVSGKRPVDNVAPEPETNQKVEELRIRLREAEQAPVESRSENELLKAENERLQTAYDADRVTYRELLASALREGHLLRDSNPSKAEAQEWAKHLRRLLEDAEGNWLADIFRRPTPGYAYADLDATGEQAFVDYYLDKLLELIRRLESGRIVKLRPAFDPHEWKDWKSPPQADPKELKAKLREVEQERDSLRTKSPEAVRNLREQRRKRIEEWRSAIQNHRFGGYPRFASTVAYSQMRPYLRPEVIQMLEAPRTFHVGNEARGGSAYPYMLLDEVARIEREWNLI